MASPLNLSYFPPFHRLLVVVVVVIFLCPSLTISQPLKNVTLGSSLTAHNNDSFWPSPSGDFAFGFLQFGTSFLLAIWFNKIPEKTVVWSANRNDLVPRGSIVQLTQQGRLELIDPTGTQRWNAALSANNGSVSYAAMLDNGNFVLASNNSQFLWQSFDLPTDTILPSQTLNGGRNLVARYSESNFSSGRFQLSMQGDGNLVFYPRNFPRDHLGTAYWSSDTIDTGFQLYFNISGSISVIGRNRTILKPLTSFTPPTDEFYHRAILEDDGVFRHYVYPKNHNENDSSWRKAWNPASTSTPGNICTSLNSGLGSGACGYNSYCSIGNEARRICTCPRGFVFVDPDDIMKGCKPTFIPQSCDLPETDAFEFFSIDNSDL